ncbi:hypothetical protein GJV26_11305 [Massilia dura]|uniref:Uncharacterized protein n=1 Tax=Pseudoduganella dura TaxID=321982 RepID=A0A6I3XFF0_9BURK|nr:hypothetical protein [Pseudoduganella dura]MUI13043.1 hypothetical protein [Pseudoduganella dura]
MPARSHPERAAPHSPLRDASSLTSALRFFLPETKIALAYYQYIFATNGLHDSDDCASQHRYDAFTDSGRAINNYEFAQLLEIKPGVIFLSFPRHIAPLQSRPDQQCRQAAVNNVGNPPCSIRQ